MNKAALTFLVALAALHLPVALRAQPISDFYKGKTIVLVVSSSVGGGYDMLSRAVARHLPKHLAGAPTIIVRNMPGAGGITAANYLYTLAPRDGLTIGGLQNSTPFEPLLGAKGANFDATKFNWLGSPSFETGLLMLWHTVPINSVEEMRTREVLVASSAANSSPSGYARLLSTLLGIKLKIVLGYPGMIESFLALENGEVEGYPSAFWSALMATRPNWVAEKKVKFIVQFGPEKEKGLGDVPAVEDLLTKPDDTSLLQAAIAPLKLGRPFVAPPGVPAERVEILQDAVMATFADPDFLAEAEKQKLGINVSRPPAMLKDIVDRAYSTPPAIIERLRAIAQRP